MGGYLMISIFPTIIHDIDVPTFKQIESDLLKFVYQEKKKDSGGVNISNVGGWQSKELDFDNILSKIIIESVEKYFITTKILNEGVRLNSIRHWININKKGDFNRMHTHPGSDLSGVCWIKTPQDCGRLEFENPNSHSRHNEINCYTDNFKQGTGIYQSWWYEPQVGRIVIFPASLYHQVKPNNSNQDRISVSFNINLTEKN